jgi:hypothetical protein
MFRRNMPPQSSGKQNSRGCISYLLHADFLLSLVWIGEMFLPNVGWHLKDYTVLCPRWRNCSEPPLWGPLYPTYYILFSTFFLYSYNDVIFRSNHVGFFFLRVRYTSYNAPWFAERTKLRYMCTCYLCFWNYRLSRSYLKSTMFRGLNSVSI